MLTQPVGPTDPARLQFSDAASCAAWLDSIALQSPTQAQESVTAQIRLAGGSDLSALERLRILEVLHQAGIFLQEELASRYVGRALPLSTIEDAHWRSALALWQALFDAYGRLLRRCCEDESALTHAPLLALRCIAFTAAAIKEHHRVYRAVPAPLWQQLHGAYAFAERLGVAAAGVADPLAAAVTARTPAAVYGRTLLAHLSNPYAMSPRQLSVMYRWAEIWESLVSIGRSAAVPGMGAAVGVDLASCSPPLPAPRLAGGDAIRYVSLEQLGQALRRLLALLRQGQEPAALGLGDDLRQPGCERLLTLLYIQWCGSGLDQPATGDERDEDADAVVGFHAACHLLSAQSEAFGADGTSMASKAANVTEQWSLAGTSAPGFMAVVRGPECDEPIQHHQLVAIRRRSAAHFQLAVAQSMRQEEDGELSIGLRLLPGIPYLTSARPEGASLRADAHAAAILLPAAPEMRTPATLILAPNTFHPERALELRSGSLQRVQMVRLLERGADFERVVFQIAA